MYFKKDFFITLIFSVGLLFCSISVNAIPARPTPVTIIQPNGEKLTIVINGDEYFNYRTTLDGYIIKANSEDIYFYLMLDEHQQVVLSSFAVHEVENRSLEEINFLGTIDTDEILRVLKEVSFDRVLTNSLLRENASFKTKRNTSKLANSSSIDHRTTSFPVIGAVKNLVVLVEFPNIEFTLEDPVQEFHDMLNQEGYNKNGTSGSARDYFIHNSGGLFLPEFDVYGPVTVTEESGYYAMENRNRWEMVAEACRILSETNQVNFADYDEDGDGIVDNVYIFYAGYGQADGGPSWSIWPHKSYIDSLNVVLDGKLVSTYACSNELANGVGETMASIGNFVHEFCHVLGLPDLYATRTGTGSFTPGAYSVLDHGTYNNSQKTPCNLTAYERYCLGWLEPIELTGEEGLNIGIRNLEESNQGYRISTVASSPDEFYILENRQQVGWDEYIPGHGMLVWHIDYDETVWKESRVNNDKDHQYVDLIEADNDPSTGTRDGDPFPGVKNIKNFTDNTTPNMKTWAGLSLNKPITDIKEENGNIFFKFARGANGLSGKLTASAATDISYTSFTANWETLGYNVFGYILDVYYWTGTEWDYIDRYIEKDAGVSSSYTVEGLEPGTQYKYRVKAIDGFTSTEYSDEILVNTLEPTFEYARPGQVRARNISDNSFTAKWSAVDGASSYLVDVYQKEYTKPLGGDTLDFTARLNLPAGWSTNCTSTITPEGYYGEATPALRFDQDRQYLQSPIYERELTRLSFWYAGRDISPENYISLKVYTGYRWVEVWKKDNLNPANVPGGQVIEFRPEEIGSFYAISITYNKIGDGYFHLDDVIVEYGSETVIHEVEQKEVNAAQATTLSADITDLSTNEYYYFTVTGLSGEMRTRPSLEVKVLANAALSIGKEELSSSIFVTEEGIHIEAADNNLKEVSLYDFTGNQVFATKFYRSVILPKKNLKVGIYLIKIDQQVYKVSIN